MPTGYSIGNCQEKWLSDRTPIKYDEEEVKQQAWNGLVTAQKARDL